MAEKCCNEALVESTGPDKPMKEAVNAYDSAHGKYEGQKPAITGSPKPSANQPSFIKTMSKE